MEDLSHSSDVVYSFDFDLRLNEESVGLFESFEDVVLQFTDSIHSSVEIGRLKAR